MVKRLLLVMMVACCVTCGYAQKVASRANGVKLTKKEMMLKKVQKNDLLKNVLAETPQVVTNNVKGPKASFADGFYYTRPAGVLYDALTRDNMLLLDLKTFIPPFNDMVKSNVVAPKSQDQMAFEIRYGGSVEDVTEDCYDPTTQVFTHYSVRPGYLIPYPTMIQGADEFIIDEDNKNKKNGAYLTADMETDRMAFYNAHSEDFTGYAFGGFDNGYIFGTGKLSGAINIVAFEQDYEAPVSPLYVENIEIYGLSLQAETPIPEGKAVKMTILNTETEEVMVVLTAEKDDVEPTGEEPTTRDGNTYSWYHYTFSHKVEDEFGSLTAEPFTIDGPFTCIITFDEGVDVGFCGVENPVYDKMHGCGMVSDDGKVYRYVGEDGKDAGDALWLTFNAFFDAAQVYGAKTEEGYIDVGDAEIKIETDGTSEDYALVRTAVPWYGFEYDEEGYVVVLTDGEEQYFLDELPDWVIGVYADVSEWDGEDLPAFNGLIFECEPLPKGVDGRAATLKVVGRGIESEQTITLLQGNATGINDIAVKNVVNNGKAIYNLSGQRVSKSYKGVILFDGKKYLNR